MKTRYSPRVRILGAHTLLPILVVIVVACAVGVRVFFPAGFFFLATPLFAFGNYVSEEASLETKEERQLKDENQALRIENETLRAALQDVGHSAEISKESFVMGVLSRPPVSPYDTLVLGGGSDTGVTTGALVTAQGVPIGTVEEVGVGYTKVVLFSLVERQNEGWVGEERLPLTLIGRGGGTFVAEVSREMPVKEGDIVYLPGPGALPVGQVTRIEGDTSSPSATLRIRSLINIFSIPYVHVEKAVEPPSV